jgi:hypothetical protein
MIEPSARRVMIYDEAGFSRVCSALLEMSGCTTEILGRTSGDLNSADIGVLVTSYPYGAFMLGEAQKRKIPTVVLFDDVNEQFIEMLHSHENFYCMIKPVDYAKFKGLVRQLLNGSTISPEDYTVF